jgi:uroporphyrinogen decarboxylase
MGRQGKNMPNSRFVNAVVGSPQQVPPVWFMRQAGRYHKHYQNMRLKHSFMELCKKPELAAEVALGPIKDFDFDVAILFSDLLFPLEALGMGLEYGDKGPTLDWNLRPETLSKLLPLEDALPSLQFQKEAMSLTRKALSPEKSLIGFVGGPWTLFTYAVQGRHDGSLIEAKKNMSIFSGFCEILLPLLIENIKLQFEGGAEIVMLFDTAAGELSPTIYWEEIVPQLKRLALTFPQKLGYYSKGTQDSFFHDKIFKGGFFAGLGFDHRYDLTSHFKDATGFVQGNFDQALLFSELSDFKKHLEDYLTPFANMSPKARAGWVCGLGHGVLPQTPEDHVRRFVQTVRERLDKRS